MQMIKKLKTAMFLLMLFLLPTIVYGQVSDNMTDLLDKTFRNYCKEVPREEVFVHTDRSEYIAGETIWFQVYILDRQTSAPSLNSRIAYLELLNSENRPVAQKKILTINGKGPGQVLLPDTLSTGTYTLRSYTSWMKNFLPYNCFSKEIRIYNVLNVSTVTDKYKVNKRVRVKTDTLLDKNTEIKGFSIKVKNTNKDSIALNVTSDQSYRMRNNNLFYLFIQTHGNTDFLKSENFTGDSTSLFIPKRILKPGINQIVAFNSEGKPIGEVYNYTPSKKKISAEITSSDSYKLRDKIALEIDITDNIPEKDTACLSLSVAPYTREQGSDDIEDYMVFGSEFGSLPFYMLKGRKISAISAEAMDSILMNIKSNWIDWTNILSGTLPYLKYKFERKNHFLTGTLLDNNNQASGNEIVIMCSPGKIADFQYSRTDNHGNFRFSLNIDEEIKDLILMPANIDKNLKIVVESPFSDKYHMPYDIPDSSTVSIPSYISKWMVNYQVQAIYGFSSTGPPFNPVFKAPETVRFYGKPDFELIMADYIKLPTMEEVFFELLPHVSLKKKKNNYEIIITDRIDNTPYVTIPTLMVDGVIIHDPGIIVNLDPETVEKIDVIRGQYLVGKYLFPGLINVITRSGDFSSFTLPGYMVRIKYRATDPVMSFLSPGYSTAELKNDRDPDYRNTLYWNPEIKPHGKGQARVEFYSSDNKGDYLLSIQGFTKKGKLLSFDKILHVK